jgi:hypothetical protein
MPPNGARAPTNHTATATDSAIRTDDGISIQSDYPFELFRTSDSLHHHGPTAARHEPTAQAPAADETVTITPPAITTQSLCDRLFYHTMYSTYSELKCVFHCL